MRKVDLRDVMLAESDGSAEILSGKLVNLSYDDDAVVAVGTDLALTFVEDCERRGLGPEQMLAALALMNGGVMGSIVNHLINGPKPKNGKAISPADAIMAGSAATEYQTLTGLAAAGTLSIDAPWTKAGPDDPDYEEGYETHSAQYQRPGDESFVTASLECPDDPGNQWYWSVTYDTGEDPEVVAEATASGKCDTFNQAKETADTVMRYVAVVPPGGLCPDMVMSMGNAAKLCADAFKVEQ